MTTDLDILAAQTRERTLTLQFGSPTPCHDGGGVSDDSGLEAWISLYYGGPDYKPGEPGMRVVDEDCYPANWDAIRAQHNFG